MQRTLRLMREAGYDTAIVERRVPFKRITIDLWGFVDVLGVHRDTGHVIGIQCTSGSNVSARVTKARGILAEKPWLRHVGEFSVWGWRKLKSGWAPKVVSL